MDAAIIYWSKSGNTEKVALVIQDSLREAGSNVLLKKVEDAGDIDIFAYDLICSQPSRGRIEFFHSHLKLN